MEEEMIAEIVDRPRILVEWRKKRRSEDSQKTITGKN